RSRARQERPHEHRNRNPAPPSTAPRRPNSPCECRDLQTILSPTDNAPSSTIPRMRIGAPSIKLPALPKLPPLQTPKQATAALDSFVDAFQRKDGPKIDPFNAAKDWMSDRVFNKLMPPGPPEALQGPQRVAYGPLDAPPTLKRPVVMIPGL